MSGKRRRWWLWLLLIAAAICAVLFLRCAGIGFGVGGGASTPRPTTEPETRPKPQPLAGGATADAAIRRCQVRVDSGGVTLAGDSVETADVVARCPGGVELTVTGDARYGDAKALREGLKAAGIDLLDRSLD